MPQSVIWRDIGYGEREIYEKCSGGGGEGTGLKRRFWEENVYEIGGKIFTLIIF